MINTKLNLLQIELINLIWTFEGTREERHSKCIKELNDVRHSALMLLCRFHSDLPEIVHDYLFELIRYEFNKQRLDYRILSNYLKYVAID